MQNMYEVGFKDVYPWVWSVMLGVSLALAERRGSFLPGEVTSKAEVWLKTLVALVLNVVLPSLLFALTMVNVGPKYPSNMDACQVLGSLYLASTPLGSHHLWLLVAKKRNWIQLAAAESSEGGVGIAGHALWAILAFAIPSAAAVLRVTLPW